MMHIFITGDIQKSIVDLCQAFETNHIKDINQIFIIILQFNLSILMYLTKQSNQLLVLWNYKNINCLYK
ncbi:unnamed protein product [Paramecium pentaurelia]|uniref:Uncharacterized protein n=1 Tax=Paramecium pentaurelia TaxID=43138 RepID=A0A8S1Y4S2_9CILI|nr:unnamed protein product [Paramecium pentaurelia]